MQDWNAVICVNERGFKRAFEVFGDFGEVKRTEFFNVLLMQAENLQDMLEALRARSLEQPQSLSFLARLVPVTQTFIFNAPDEFETKAQEIVLAWVPLLAHKSFHVRLRRRGFKGRLSSVDEEQFLDTVLLESLERSGTPGKIAFEKPDAVIAIETVGTWAGLSLWAREELEKYPFIRVS
jgi:tRNA(Ser,Leu) C12 N-acetylase TAN1